MSEEIIDDFHASNLPQKHFALLSLSSKFENKDAVEHPLLAALIKFSGYPAKQWGHLIATVIGQVSAIY